MELKDIHFVCQVLQKIIGRVLSTIVLQIKSWFLIQQKNLNFFSDRIF